MSKQVGIGNPKATITPIQNPSPESVHKKKRGRPKGFKNEYSMGLSSKTNQNEDSDDLSSSYDSADGSEISADTLDSSFDSEDEDMSCLTDLDDSRILPIRKVSDTIQKICAARNLL